MENILHGEVDHSEDILQWEVDHTEDILHWEVDHTEDIMEGEVDILVRERKMNIPAWKVNVHVLPCKREC